MLGSVTIIIEVDTHSIYEAILHGFIMNLFFYPCDRPDLLKALKGIPVKVQGQTHKAVKTN